MTKLLKILLLGLLLPLVGRAEEDIHITLGAAVYWKPSSGTNADLIGGIAATNVANLPSTTTNGWEFDGTQYVDVGSPEILRPGTNSFTMSCWINHRESTGWLGLGSAWEASAYFRWFLLSYQPSGTNVPIAIWQTDGGGQIVGNQSEHFETNEWHHLAATFSRGSSVVLYVDGSPSATSAVNFANATVNIVFSHSFTIGMYPDSNKLPAHFGIGKMDGLAYFSYALSGSQVSNLWITSKRQLSKDYVPPPAPAFDITNGLVGWWKFDEGSGTNAYDSSGNGNDAYLSAATGVGYWTEGAKAGAWLPTNSMYVLTPVTNAFGDFAVSLWFYDRSPESVVTYQRLVDKNFSDGFWLGRQGEEATVWGGGAIAANAPYGIYAVFPTGRWNHVVLMRGSTNQYLYANGVLAAYGLVSNTLMNAGFVRICGASMGPGWDLLDVIIDDVRIYNRALSSNEVWALYSGGGLGPVTVLPATRTAWNTASASTPRYAWNTNDLVLEYNVPDKTAVNVPGMNGQTYNARIFWSTNQLSKKVTAYNDADLTHSYSYPGTKTIVITGEFPAVYFNYTGSKLLLTKVPSLGSHLTTLYSAFYGCTGLTEVVGIVSNITSAAYAFGENTSLTNMDVSGWDMSSVQSMASMFNACSRLGELDVGDWDVSSVTSLNEAFRSCSSLKLLDVGSWVVSNVTDLTLAFYNCASLTNLDVSTWNVSKVTSMNGMLAYDLALGSIDVAAWIVSNVTDMSYVFLGCTSLTNLDVSTWNVGKVTSMLGTFQSSGLISLDVATWNMASVVNLDSTFHSCSLLSNLDVSAWNISNAVNMFATFFNCGSLTNGLIQQWPPKLTTAQYVYHSCWSLVGDMAEVGNYAVSNLYLGLYNTDKLTYSHANGCLSSNIAHGFNLDWSDSKLIAPHVDNVLVDLNASGASNGTVNISGDGNQPPSYVGVDAKTQLVNKGWTATTTAGYVAGTNDFVMLFDIDDTNAVTVPGNSGYSYASTIFHGDGVSGSVTAYNDADLTYSYGAPGVYQITITGSFPSIYFNNAGNRTNLLSVESFGNVGLASLQNAFYGCGNCTNFGSLLGHTNVTSLYYAWYGCSSASNFPEVNQMGTNVLSLSGAWVNCSGAKSFPAVSNLTWISNLGGTWYGCRSATNFPVVDTLISNTSLATTWYYCESARSFPEVNSLTNVTSLESTWGECYQATNFPSVNNLINVTTLYQTWRFCDHATTFPNVDTLTKNTTLNQTWLGCYSALSFPEVNTLTNVTDISFAWYICPNATNFPAVSNLTKVTAMDGAWNSYSGSKVTSVPEVNTLTNVTTMYRAWYGLGLVTNFPPVSNLVNVTRIWQSWYACSNMIEMPYCDTLTNVDDVSGAFTDCRMATNDAPEFWLPSKFPKITTGYDQYVFSGCTNLSNWSEIPASFGGPGTSTNALKMVWQVESNQTVVLPLRSGYNPSAFIEWNNGSNGYLTTYNDTHTTNIFAAAGVATSMVYGTVPTIYFGYGGNKTNLLSVDMAGREVASLEGAFYGCNNLTNVNMVGSYGATNFYNAFRGCNLIVSAPDVSGHTNNTALIGAFYECQSMTNAPDVSAHKLNTTLLMAFYACNDMINAPDISTHTNNTSLLAAFRTCYAMKDAPDVSAHVLNTTLNSAFNACVSMTNTPDVSGHVLNTSLYYAFADCSKMKLAPDVSGHTNNVTLAYAFSGSAITNSPDVSKHILNTTLENIFASCPAMGDAPPITNMPLCITMQQSFYNCRSMSNAPVLNMPINTNLYQAFYGCTNMADFPDLSSQTNLYDVRGAFYNCWRGTNAVPEFWDLSQFPHMTWYDTNTFYGCTNASNWLDIPQEFGGPPYSPGTNDFVMKLNITDANAFNIPANSGYAYTGTVFWGDGAVGHFTNYNSTALSHTYAATGEYWCVVTGLFPAIYFNNVASNALKVVAVTNFGNVGWANGLERGFQTCTNLVHMADIPVVDAVTSLEYAWHMCISLTNAFNVLGLTNVTSCYGTWSGCSSLKEAPAVSNLIKVTNLEYAWYLCSGLTNMPYINTLTNVTSLAFAWRFNTAVKEGTPVSNLISVTSLYETWRDCTAMTNAPYVNSLTNVTTLRDTWAMCYKLIEPPAVSNLTKVTSLAVTWYECGQLRYAPDVSTLTNVTSMLYAWYACINMTNGLITVLPTSLVTAQYAYNNDELLMGDVSAIANYAVSNMYLGFRNADKLTYSATSGCLSSNIANGFNLDWSDSKLAESNVNNILIDLDTSGSSNGVVNLSGDTSAAPSGAGLVSKTNLVNKGWTVTHN